MCPKAPIPTAVLQGFGRCHWETRLFEVAAHYSDQVPTLEVPAPNTEGCRTRTYRTAASDIGLAIAIPLASLAGTATPVYAQTLKGRVVGVTDGDTIKLLVGGRNEYKVRLGEIDAPESGQPFGQKSKRMLSDLVFNRTVIVRVTDIDRYGRSVGVIQAGKTNVNAEMVKRGGAWAYRRYLSD